MRILDYLPPQSQAPNLGDPPLGILTKSTAALNAVLPDAAALNRLKKYELQSVARKVLYNHRISICLRSLLPGSGGVPVHFAPASKSAHYSQLQVCGSIWFCPVCASKISERRRIELEKLLHWSVERGYTTLLVTYTFSHTRNDDLGSLLERFLHAQERMTGNRPYKRLKAARGVLHGVKALEVTWGGSNGWHPHSHWLLVCSSNVNVVSMKRELFKIWRGELAKVGLSCDLAHGVDIQNTFGSIADYVSKFGKQKSWGAEHELSKAHLKKPRGSETRYAPFQLLEWLNETGEYLPKELFMQYAAFFHGRRQLVWSKKLRELVGLKKEEKKTADQADLELAQEIEQDAVVLAVLSPEDWSLVKRLDQRGQLLEVARTGDPGRVLSYLDELRAILAARLESEEV